MKAKKIVIKIGTNVLTTEDGKLDPDIIKNICHQIGELKKTGIDIIVVSSGAVGAGRSLVPGTENLDPVSRRQILASVGQIRLMNIYADFLEKSGLVCAQVLATKEDFRDRKHYLNIRNCLNGLLKKEVVPIVNENDVIAITELMFTDNDELAGLITAMMGFDALVILTNIEGLYNKSPREKDAQVVSEVTPGELNIGCFITREKSSFGRGGMMTKCEVAQKLSHLGIETRVVNGKRPDVVLSLLQGDSFGTRFIPFKKVSSHKKWTAFAGGFEKGIVTIDDGAEKALRSQEKVSSLLFVGVKKIEGEFLKGDIVKIRNMQGKDIGMGIAQYDSKKAKTMVGQKKVRPLIHYNYLFLEK